LGDSENIRQKYKVVQNKAATFHNLSNKYRIDRSTRAPAENIPGDSKTFHFTSTYLDNYLSTSKYLSPSYFPSKATERCLE